MHFPMTTFVSCAYSFVASLLWVLLLPSNATSCHILCVYLVPRVQVSIGRCHHPAFTTHLIVVLFWLHSSDVLTCMRTNIAVSSCHLNAVRSLSYSADCLSIGCVNTCVYSFVCHFIRGCDFSIKSLPAEVDASVSSISGTWQTTLTSNPMVWSHTLEWCATH